MGMDRAANLRDKVTLARDKVTRLTQVRKETR
jgi:hypothetical protein